MTDRHFQISQHVLAQDSADDIMVLNLETEQYYRFAGPAQQMWLQLAEHGSANRTVEALARLYEADTDLLTSDVTSFCQQLLSLGLLSET